MKGVRPISLAQTLLDAGLVDELRIVVAPVAQTHGRKLFDNRKPHRLSLARGITSPSGYLLLDFQVRT